jgi:hypothetical protein
MKVEKDIHRHGGPFDRGSADAWYLRPYKPHYFKGATYNTEEVLEADMTAEEILEYKQGFDEGMASGEHKQ